jgi:L-aspartate oxidase
MGGVRTDLDGRTSIARLFAAGEVASTGVHGANRLASNSLLEGVVFGARAGRAMREVMNGQEGCPTSKTGREGCTTFRAPRGESVKFRELAWAQCGIVRCADGLRHAVAALESDPEDGCEFRPERSEARNIRQNAWLIARCALAREESRGAHFRTDFPAKRPEFEKHSVISRDAGVRFV